MMFVDLREQSSKKQRQLMTPLIVVLNRRNVVICSCQGSARRDLADVS